MSLALIEIGEQQLLNHSCYKKEIIGNTHQCP